MHTAYIGLGANLPSTAGAPEATLAAAADRLDALGRVAARSLLYSTAPVGYAEQPRFVNAVVRLETELTPRALLEALMGIEQEFGRDRSAGIANGPRTLDLDILLYCDYVVGEAGLEIPHPRLAERAFVLVPLNEIAAETVDPLSVNTVGSGRTVGELLQSLSSLPDYAAQTVVPFDSDLWRAGAAGAGGEG
jgi:2-amino-4-hydroxy-6-hydroxymethyldihydropteridine diphosphokinase